MADKEKMKTIRKVENAALLKKGDQYFIRVSNVRLSYPHLDKPYKKEGDKGVAKYGVVGLLPKDTHGAARKLINEEIERVLKETRSRPWPLTRNSFATVTSPTRKSTRATGLFRLAKSAAPS
jgi:hypothetical protein